MILVVVAVHAVAAHGLQVGKGGQVILYHLEMLSIGAVVHGIRLFLANDNAVFYQASVVYQAQADDFCGGELN